MFIHLSIQDLLFQCYFPSVLTFSCIYQIFMHLSDFNPTLVTNVTVAMQMQLKKSSTRQYEPRSEKTGLRGFRPGPIQTRLYSHRRWLEA